MKKLAAILLTATVLLPASARSGTEWMGGARQWSVGFVGDGPKPYCRLLWDSQLGRTVEFRQSLTDIVWLVARDAWDVPAGTRTEVAIVGRESTKTIPAEFFDRNTLRLWPATDKAATAGIKKIIRQSFSGTPDMELSFAGTEGTWTLPLSRVEQLYSTYVACLDRLPAAATAKEVTALDRPF